MAERWELEDLPGHSLTVLLFRDVSNASELKEQVLKGLFKPECSLINASLVPDALVLRAAAHKAAAAQQRGALRTRSVHAELVFNLSGSKHIGETLGRYGIGPDCRHVLAARFDATPDEAAAIPKLVAGTLAPLSELAALADVALLTKYLKPTREELSVGSMAEAQLMRMSARDC